MGQDHSDLKMVCDTTASKDVSIQQIWDSHLKKYKICSGHNYSTN